MAKLKSDDNPFNPGPATPPLHVAGRHKERELIDDALARIEILSKTKKQHLTPGALAPIKIVGPRGVGKTTLLSEAQKMAEERNIQALSLAQLDSLTDRKLLVGLVGQKAYEKAIAKLSNISGVSAGPIGISFEPTEMNFETSLRKKMSRKPLLLLLDEVMHYERKALGGMLQVCQGLIREYLPLAVILAGTPRLDQILRQVSATFINRSNDIYINEFSHNETKDALATAFRKRKVKVAEEALQRMIELTDHYPFFIQIVGSQIWKAMVEADKREISLELVKSAESEIERLRLAFYDKIHADIMDEELIPHASRTMEILHKNQGKVRREVIVSGLGKNAKGVYKKKYIDIFAKLADHGFIWQKDGWVKAGIPSFFSYCQQRAEEVSRSENG